MRREYCGYEGKESIFDKVFRGVYEKEIRKFDAKVIREESSAELKKEKRSMVSCKLFTGGNLKKDIGDCWRGNGVKKLP